MSEKGGASAVCSFQPQSPHCCHVFVSHPNMWEAQQNTSFSGKLKPCVVKKAVNRGLTTLFFSFYFFFVREQTLQNKNKKPQNWKNKGPLKHRKGTTGHNCLTWGSLAMAAGLNPPMVLPPASWWETEKRFPLLAAPRHETSAQPGLISESKTQSQTHRESVNMTARECKKAQEGNHRIKCCEALGSKKYYFKRKPLKNSWASQALQPWTNQPPSAHASQTGPREK